MELLSIISLIISAAAIGLTIAGHVRFNKSCSALEKKTRELEKVNSVTPSLQVFNYDKVPEGISYNPDTNTYIVKGNLAVTGFAAAGEVGE